MDAGTDTRDRAVPGAFCCPMLRQCFGFEPAERPSPGQMVEVFDDLQESGQREAQDEAARLAAATEELRLEKEALERRTAVLTAAVEGGEKEKGELKQEKEALERRNAELTVALADAQEDKEKLKQFKQENESWDAEMQNSPHS